jgi:hypothetical protein
MSSTFTVLWSLLVSSHSVRKQRRCQSNSSCCFRQVLELWCGSCKGGGDGSCRTFRRRSTLHAVNDQRLTARSRTERRLRWPPALQPPAPRGGGLANGPQAPPRVTFRRVVVSLRGPGQSPVLPFACCVGLLLSVGCFQGPIQQDHRWTICRTLRCAGGTLTVHCLPLVKHI